MEYKVGLAAVNVPGETYPMMEQALRAGKIGQTELIEQFEEAVALYAGVRYCIAISNGTMADAVAIAATRLRIHPNPIKRVIVPALTFVAQPNSVLYNGLELEFVDVKEDWTIDVSGARHLYADSLIFGTDLMGRQCLEEMDVEDACESFGSRYDGQRSGSFGCLGTYSFFPSHTISTGEGGAIVTNSEQLAQLCRSIRAHGVGATDPLNKFHFPNFGFNARMTSLQAVLGFCLMLHVNEYVQARRENFKLMQSALGGFEEKDGEEIVPHGYPIEYDCEASRDSALLNLVEAGIETRKFFSCLPLEEPHLLSSGHFPVASHIAHTHLYIPCHQNMTFEDVSYAVEVVKRTSGRVIKTSGSKLQARLKQMVRPEE